MEQQHAIEQFYYREARMLDDRRFLAWLELLTEDVRYVIPTRHISLGDPAGRGADGFHPVERELGGPEVLKIEEIELSPPGEGEVQIRQAGIGLNFIDVYFRTGLYKAANGLPFVPGKEGAGTVTATSSSSSSPPCTSPSRMGSRSRVYSSRSTGTVTVFCSVTTCLRRRMRPVATRSLPTCSSSS